MSSQKVKVPPFDALVGVAMPYAGFGDILPYSTELEKEFRTAAANAREQLRKSFRQGLEIPFEIPKELDLIVVGMWSTGWDPLTGNVNLFVRDFGLVLMQSILGRLGGTAVFRSKEDLTHLSVFWKDSNLEAFPFHKTLKCVLNQYGESMVSFVEGLSGCIEGHPKKGPSL